MIIGYILLHKDEDERERGEGGKEGEEREKTNNT